MKTFVALLRGINVGGHNRLPMTTLKQILEKMDCREVQTYIQSGNVVFDSERQAGSLSRQIAAAIKDSCGFEPQVLVLERADFEQAAKDNPFPVKEPDAKTLHLGFLETTPDKPDLEGLKLLASSSERFRLIGKVFYLHAPDGIGRSKLAAKSEKLIGVAMTDRNWNTVGKIMSLLDSRIIRTPISSD